MIARFVDLLCLMRIGVFALGLGPLANFVVLARWHLVVLGGYACNFEVDLTVVECLERCCSSIFAFT